MVTDSHPPFLGPNSDSGYGGGGTWGQISAIRPVPVVDGLLAATAIAHDMTLVTRNVSDVEGLGVRVLDPFSGNDNSHELVQ